MGGNVGRGGGKVKRGKGGRSGRWTTSMGNVIRSLRAESATAGSVLCIPRNTSSLHQISSNISWRSSKIHARYELEYMYQQFDWMG